MNPIEVSGLLRPQLRVPLLHERRRAGDSSADLLERMLDEIDYGLLLVTVRGELCYANRLAQHELAAAGPLQLAGARLQLSACGESRRLFAALADAARGRRSLVTLTSDARALLVAVIPIEAGCDDDGEHLALLVFNKRDSCVALTIAFYARSSGLTATESAVLLRLSEGLDPKDIAHTQGVALSTVRSQIASIRTKTRTASIRELASRVAKLPPFAPALRAIGALRPAAPRLTAPARAAPARALEVMDDAATLAC